MHSTVFNRNLYYFMPFDAEKALEMHGKVFFCFENAFFQNCKVGF